MDFISNFTENTTVKEYYFENPSIFSEVVNSRVTRFFDSKPATSCWSMKNIDVKCANRETCVVCVCAVTRRINVNRHL